MSETEKFLEDLEVKPDSILETPIETAPVEESAEEVEQRAKNRRERRLLEKNQQLREEVLMTNARLQGITEAQELRKTTEEADYLKLVDKIYGNATPEAKEATELLKEALKGVHASARKEALEEAVKTYQSERENESQAVADEEENLDEMMDGLEEDYDADFSNEATRKGFLDLLEKVSPKDRDGNIIEYADPDTTWQLYEQQRTRGSNRAKELASRSMTRSGGSQESKLTSDATERWLKENGII